MSDYLFAYGTLQPDHVPEEIASAVGNLKPVGKGSVRGVLYDLGEYPGAVIDPSSRKRIYGTVLRLSSDENLLREIDEYEGFNPHAPGESLFVRKLCPVRLTTGRIIPCWVYAYNRNIERAQVLTSGQYGKVLHARRGKTGVAPRPQAQRTRVGR
jgi:gamma-glutamylcyclotransferase (GGCT)/AIG2-like uncharacterized protein YtfP